MECYGNKETLATSMFKLKLFQRILPTNSHCYLRGKKKIQGTFLSSQREKGLSAMRDLVNSCCWKCKSEPNQMKVWNFSKLLAQSNQTPKSPKIIVEYKNVDIQILNLHLNILLLTKKEYLVATFLSCCEINHEPPEIWLIFHE